MLADGLRIRNRNPRAQTVAREPATKTRPSGQEVYSCTYQPAKSISTSLVPKLGRERPHTGGALVCIDWSKFCHVNKQTNFLPGHNRVLIPSLADISSGRVSACQ